MSQNVTWLNFQDEYTFSSEDSTTIFTHERKKSSLIDRVGKVRRLKRSKDIKDDATEEPLDGDNNQPNPVQQFFDESRGDDKHLQNLPPFDSKTKIASLQSWIENTRKLTLQEMNALPINNLNLQVNHLPGHGLPGEFPPDYRRIPVEIKLIPQIVSHVPAMSHCPRLRRQEKTTGYRNPLTQNNILLPPPEST